MLHLTSDNIIVQLLALCIAFVLLATPSYIPTQFVSTIQGKAIAIAIIYFVAVAISPIVGALFAIVFVMLISDITEGMSNNSATTDIATTDIANTPDKFRKKHCKKTGDKTVFVDAEGQTVSIDEMKDRFPNVSFNGSACDPCEDSCDFTVVERMSVEENIRRKKEGRGTQVTRADRANLST